MRINADRAIPRPGTTGFTGEGTCHIEFIVVVLTAGTKATKSSRFQMKTYPACECKIVRLKINYIVGPSTNLLLLSRQSLTIFL